MRDHVIKRAVGMAAALCVVLQPSAQVAPNRLTADAAINYSNAKVASQGVSDGNAVMTETFDPKNLELISIVFSL